jgi:hypothetical protein
LGFILLSLLIAKILVFRFGFFKIAAGYYNKKVKDVFPVNAPASCVLLFGMLLPLMLIAQGFSFRL